MTRRIAVCHAACLLGALAQLASAAGPLPPIEKVEIEANRAFSVNGRPFFPLMAWLQDAENFPAVKACGMNTAAGYWPGSSGTDDVAEYLELVARAGLYGVMPFDERLQGHASLLGYIHDDEPDLPHQVSDAEVVPAEHLRINRSTPLWKLVDGVWHTWSVLDPLEGAAVTVRLDEPVTVESLAVWLTVSPGLAVAKEVSFEGDGKPIARATLESKKGKQTVELARPATFTELKMTVHSTHPGEHVWGSIGEIGGFDSAGENVLVSPPRYEPRAWPPETLAEYEAIQAADATRPVFMTLTGHFHPHFQKWTEDQRRELYPQYLRATDVVGYDIYPIYGWNKPEWIHLVHDATRLLVEQAGPRPVYAWIETSKGGQWTGPLERQKDVRPEHIRAEVWMSICGGATAIGYFTHVWKPSYRQFGVPEENRRALRAINDRITRLAPAILGDPPKRPVKIEPETEGDAKLAVLAREHAGAIYVFAVNYDERLVRTEATISVEGLPSGADVAVLDEARTLRSEPGAFRDTFEPLAVHVYRVRSEP
jgi:hypothetical protein